jgi:hypothetical protein
MKLLNSIALLIGLSMLPSVSMAVPHMPPGGSDNALTGVVILENDRGGAFMNRYQLQRSDTGQIVEIVDGPVTLGQRLKIENALLGAVGHTVQLQGGFDTDSMGNTYFSVFDVTVL